MPWMPLTESKTRLRRLRLRAKVSQNELARLARCNPATICYVEQGKRRLSADIARRIAPILKIAHWSQLFDDGPPLTTADDSSGTVRVSGPARRAYRSASSRPRRARAAPGSREG